KLVNFKRTVDELQGQKVLLLGGPAFADTLYPHVAFRPVLDIDMLLRPQDITPFSNFLGGSEFRPDLSLPGGKHPSGARRVLTDGRTQLLLYAEYLGVGRAAQEEGLFARALPMKVYGPSLFRLDLEDAILMLVLENARQGFEVPLLSFVDLRELLTGATSTGGPYSRPFDAQVLAARAREWKIERALYASVALVERLFPETAKRVEAAKPELRRATRELLERLVIQPVSQLGAMRHVRGADRLRRLLAGGA
ncbi:MAG TPA: nucleotidyltransferase family protein, partial [Myxococcaceae bacterium]|nr:nucleotidyltransferase family protein [Myxococcaceae bacterium]